MAGKRKSKKTSPALLITVFFIITFSVVLLLEYIDYSKNRPAFLLDKLFKKEKTIQKVDLVKDLKGYFKKTRTSYDHFRDREGKHHFKFTTGNKFHQHHIENIKKLSNKKGYKMVLGEVQKKDDRTVFLFRVSSSEATHLILVTKLQPQITKTKKIPKKEVKKKSKVAVYDNSPKIAFIIDDIGEYDLGVKHLAALKIPITASILPDSPNASRESSLLKKYPLEGMLHIPMQPKNASQTNYNGGKIISLKSSSPAIRKLIKKARKIVPYAKGINNHQGSLATSNRDLMIRLMKEIKKQKMYFIDSRTDSDTVAAVIAKRTGVPTASRAVFLDHQKSYKHSMEQIRILVDTAIIKGHAIAIGHPFDTTINAIRDSLKYIKKRGIKIVFASSLVR